MIVWNWETGARLGYLHISEKQISQQIMIKANKLLNWAIKQNGHASTITIRLETYFVF